MTGGGPARAAGGGGPRQRPWGAFALAGALIAVGAVLALLDRPEPREPGDPAAAATPARDGCATRPPAATAPDAAWPAPLSAARARAPIASDAGSGRFGRWFTDRFGLPAYRFEDGRDLPRASIENRAEGWHQLGNDRLVALASNRGDVQLWSQARRYQWVNRYDEAGGHPAGGFGYLRHDGRTFSTRTADAGDGARLEFGVGYVRRCRPAGALRVDEHVYAPFGETPALLHDVHITNMGDRPARAAWTELWDVNPVDQTRGEPIEVAAPEAGEVPGLLVARQRRTTEDRRPLAIFAAGVGGTVTSTATDAERFFGRGGVRAPDGAAAPALGDTRAADGAPAVLALRSPVVVAPGASVTLRYVFGAEHPERIAALVRRLGRAPSPLERSQQRWSAWLPQLRLPERARWATALNRETQWAAAAVRQATTYEEACGHHILSQGGAYQYGLGQQIAVRDPLQHALAMVHTRPETALEVLRYSAGLQTRAGALPFGVRGLCRPVPNDGSIDLDVWLLLLAAEYGLATRDLAAFDARVPFRDAGSATLWEHLELAVRHQERLRGPHGGYELGNGDWSDGLGPALRVTESALVAAQAAYVYPRLGELALARGDRAAARRLRRLGARAGAAIERVRVGEGWYARGWRGDALVGETTLFAEPQPWALLAGLPDRAQTAELMERYQRLLQGVGAPPEVGGPARIGSAQVPSGRDPLVSEVGLQVAGAGESAASYPGGVWYAVNGWLTWALARADGRLDRARALAYDEWRRNSLTAHATAFPRAWSGVLSVDDACAAFYSNDPDRCGILVSTQIDTLNLHQPAWMVWNAAALAGIEATATGYRFAPHLDGDFALRMEGAGVEVTGPRLRGYVRPRRSGRITLEVVVPGGRAAEVLVDGRRRRFERVRDGVRVRVRARARRPLDWAVEAG